MKVDGHSLSWESFVSVVFRGEPAELEPEAARRMLESRRALEEAAAHGPVYGYNTGLGKLAEVKLSAEELKEFQLNTVRSHAAGTGPLASPEVIRGTLLVRANTLARGHSGVRPQVVQKLLELLNLNVLPAVPKMGSVGASGDLAPLAHIALALVGEGEVLVDGRTLPSLIAFRERGLEPLELEPREALALLNGTAYSAALLGVVVAKAQRLVEWADRVAALTFSQIGSRRSQFSPRLLEVRPHPGQVESGRRIWELLEDFEDGQRVQDAYSLRCAPQVHGAALDVLSWAKEVLVREFNSSVDNPLVLEGRALSGGNFHGQIVAFAADAVASALVALASISERRTFRLLTPELSGLPPFLAQRPGLESGLMMLQVSQAALVSYAKSLAHPASVDSIPTSGDQEDFVPMAANAALKAEEILELAKKVIAGELTAAVRAARLSGKPVPPKLRPLYESYLERVKPKEGDSVVAQEWEKAQELLDLAP